MVWHTTPKDDAWKQVTVRSVKALCQNLWLRRNHCDHEVVIDAVVFSERSNVSFDTREANREPAMIPPKSKRWRASSPNDREEPAGLCGLRDHTQERLWSVRWRLPTIRQQRLRLISACPAVSSLASFEAGVG